jgi:hypothetical protein
MKLLELIKLLQEKPMTVFIVLSCLFGYGYYEQSKQINTLLLEVGGLRVQVELMHNIIKE